MSRLERVFDASYDLFALVFNFVELNYWLAVVAVSSRRLRALVYQRANFANVRFVMLMDADDGQGTTIHRRRLHPAFTVSDFARWGYCGSTVDNDARGLNGRQVLCVHCPISLRLHAPCDAINKIVELCFNARVYAQSLSKGVDLWGDEAGPHGLYATRLQYCTVVSVNNGPPFLLDVPWVERGEFWRSPMAREAMLLISEAMASS